MSPNDKVHQHSRNEHENGKKRSECKRRVQLNNGSEAEHEEGSWSEQVSEESRSQKQHDFNRSLRSGLGRPDGHIRPRWRGWFFAWWVKRCYIVFLYCLALIGLAIEICIFVLLFNNYYWIMAFLISNHVIISITLFQYNASTL